MRTNALMIIVAPVAGWAVFAGLSLIGASPVIGGIAGLAWGLAWLGAALAVEPHGRFAQWGDRSRDYGETSRRRYMASAIVATTVLPIPAFLLAFLFQGLDLIPALVALPLLLVVGSPVPAVLWWMALRRRATVVSGPIMAMGWKRYEPAPAAVRLPPRNSTALRLGGMLKDERNLSAH